MTVFNSVTLGAYGIYTIEENVSNITKPRDCPLLPNNPGKLIKVPLAQCRASKRETQVQTWASVQQIRVKGRERRTEMFPQ